MSRAAGVAAAVRPPQPRPDLLQVDHLADDGAVGQARGGPRQDKPGQRVGLERGERQGQPECAPRADRERPLAPPAPPGFR